jgi:hypothetical protein
MKTAEDLIAWRQNGGHLPAFMKDFHDQKDLFKTIHQIYTKAEEGKAISMQEMPNWREAQCYTIDWFLWFMATHGYTLQRSRRDLPFSDIDQTINESREASVKALSLILGEKK